MSNDDSSNGLFQEFPIQRVREAKNANHFISERLENSPPLRQ